MIKRQSEHRQVIVIPGGQSSYSACVLEMIFEQRPEGLEGEYSRQKKQNLQRFWVVGHMMCSKDKKLVQLKWSKRYLSLHIP